MLVGSQTTKTYAEYVELWRANLKSDVIFVVNRISEVTKLCKGSGACKLYSVIKNSRVGVPLYSKTLL